MGVMPTVVMKARARRERASGPFRLFALESLTGTRRRRRVGIPKSKEGSGKKLKQIGQGGFLMLGELRFVKMTEATRSQKWISITRTFYCSVTHRRSVDCQVLGRFACF